ncbi:MAG: alpha/beta fold hydrolase [Desulfocucumaceae bacterium]
MRNIPNSRLVTLSGSGHGFMAQEPDIVTDLIRGFLG